MNLRSEIWTCQIKKKKSIFKFVWTCQINKSILKFVYVLDKFISVIYWQINVNKNSRIL